MKNVFIILLLFILLSCSLKNSGYGNSIILQTDNYEYMIKCPKIWSFFNKPTELRKISVENKEYVIPIATIIRQIPENVKDDVNASIEVYFFDKSDKFYQKWIKNISKENSKFLYTIKDFSNLKDRKLNISYNVFDKWYNANHGKSLDVIIYIEKNKAIIFDLYIEEGNEIEKEKVGREFYGIINSLVRNRIK